MAEAIGLEQRRVWGTVAVAVAALALGWLLGRSGDSTRDATAKASVTTSESTTTTPVVDEAIASVEPRVTVAPAPVVVDTTQASPSNRRPSSSWRCTSRWPACRCRSWRSVVGGD